MVECTSGNSGKVRHIAEIAAKYPEIWLANKGIAQAYGLTPDDFEYMLFTFPVFSRKRPAFYSYLKHRIAEWKEEESKMKPEAKEYPVSEGRQVHAAAESRADYSKDINNKKKNQK
ncbi:MAG: hypothetical protein WBC70_13930 [Candidatus Aminicenantales bacterium]